MKQQVKGLMTEGPIWKNILLFALPLLLGNLFQQLYNAVDSIVVGNYIGSNALAAVGSSSPIINLLVGFFSGLATGAGVVISRCFGARNTEGVSRSVHTSMALAIVCGILLSIAGVALSPWILQMMGTPEEVMSNSVLYLQIYFMGLLSVLVYNMGSGVLRAIGDSKTPLYFLIVSSILNIFLDILFVTQFQMGIAGVGWATLIAQTVSAILTFVFLMRAHGEHRLFIRKIRIHRDVLQQVIKIGLPGGMQNAIISFSNIIMQSSINSFGAVAMAGCGSYSKIDGFAILPLMSFSMALTTFTGQNIGAKRFDRVKSAAKNGTVLTLSSTCLVSLFLLLFSEQVISIFNSEPEVIHYGVAMMQVLVPGYFFLGITHTLTGIVRGAGATTVPMMIMIFCWCFLRMAWVLGSLSIAHIIQFVFLGYTLTWAISAVLMFVYYKKGDWLRHYL
ncbi:MATE family efflux transporter [uncultured Ruthenibacterium sp.]|uniref:MATE family efflux transporter n=1 Tax=uncultured Ruthenibacterium sp. TaxID=1905347 RepID=UPI00349E7F97